MRFTQSFILAALPFLTSALPAPQAVGPNGSPAYTLTAIDSGTPLQNLPIVAYNRGFYIGVNASSALCHQGSSTDLSPCTPDASTQVVFADDRSNSLALDVSVPGGQKVILSSDKALSYTPPHGSGVTKGEQATGFITDQGTIPPTGTNTTSNLEVTVDPVGQTGDWLACPDVVNDVVVYKVFLNVTDGGFTGTNKDHCHDIAIALEPAAQSSSAWEFA